MRVCPACGNKYPDDANFCPMDASKLSEPAPAVSAVAPVLAPAAALPGADSTLSDQPAPVAGRFLPSRSEIKTPVGTLVTATDSQAQNPASAAVLLQLVDEKALPTPAMADRMLRELKQLAKVKSDKLLRIIDQGKLPDGRVYVASEAPSGPSLEEIVGREGPLSFDRARAIVLAVGEALVEAQKVGVIHRDLSPKNVYLGDKIKLTGFGLAEPVTEKVFGAPAFLSPEQAEGKPVDQRSNIYSLGALLYYMATGAPPFAGDAASQVQQHLHAQPVPPSQKHAGLPPELDRLVLKALEKSGGRRHLTLRQLLNEVESIAVAAPVAAAPVEVAVPASPATPTPVDHDRPASEPAAAEPPPSAASLAVAPPPAMPDAPMSSATLIDAQAPVMDAHAPPAHLESARILMGMSAPEVTPLPAPAPPPSLSEELSGPLSMSSAGSVPIPLDKPVSFAADRASGTPDQALSSENTEPPVQKNQQKNQKNQKKGYPAAAQTVVTRAIQPAPGAAGKGGGAPGAKKGAFRETGWFKKGEIEEEMAKKAAEMSKEDPLAGPLVEANVDESALTAEDRSRLSLKTGRTEMMPVIKVKDLPGDRMSEEEMIAEIDQSRKWLFVGGGGILLVAVIAAVYFLFLR